MESGLRPATSRTRVSGKHNLLMPHWRCPGMGPLHDLRLLYLATRIEEAFEGLEKAFERHLPEGAAREALAPIFVEGPAHAQLRTAFQTVSARIEAERSQIGPKELLEAILDCESTARRFYESHASEFSDPALATIFARMAQEEAGHERAVSEALRLLPIE